MQQWDEMEQFLLDEAARDLGAGDMARPAVVAFEGDEPLLLAFLRSFEKGQYADPMIEVLALAGGLGADRLMASFSARASSWDDPIPPVLPGVGDLRQRVLHLSVVDGTQQAVRSFSVLYPFDIVDGAVVWGTRVEEGAPQGWIQRALQLCVERRNDMRAPAQEVAGQVLRCDRLGHLVGLGPGVSQRLGFGAMAGGIPGDEAGGR